MASVPAAGTRPRLVLPYDEDDKEEWLRITTVLQRPLSSLQDLDGILTAFAAGVTDQTCVFFAKIPGSTSAGPFDWDAFWTYGVPLLIEVALEMPRLFAGVELPLLLKGVAASVTLTRRQCACLLAHSFFGSITAKAAREGSREKWAFRAAQLFFLEALPSALCFLNYFKVLGQHGIPEGTVTYQRTGFPKGSPPWHWEGNIAPLVPVQFRDEASIEDSPADTQSDFANRFVGGGCLENDFNMEEILFVIKPELIVAMALNSYMHDEEVVRISGVLQFSTYSGYASTFEFVGDFDDDGRRQGQQTLATVVAMDALHGAKHRQFEEALVLRDLNKARLAFDGATTVATGNWGCGAFGNDHVLKFLQQWLAASEAGASELYYHTFGDKRSEPLPALAASLQGLSVGALWALVRNAAERSSKVFPPPNQKREFLKLVVAGHRATSTTAESDCGVVECGSTEESLEGKVVACQGAEFLCIKHNRDGQVRLQDEHGRTVWRSLATDGVAVVARPPPALSSAANASAPGAPLSGMLP